MANDKTIRQVEAALEGYRKDFAAAFIAAVQDILDSTQLKHVVEAIEAGRIEDALHLMNLSPQFFEGLRAKEIEIFAQGGVAAAALASGLPDPFVPEPASRFALALALHRLRK